MNNINKNKKLNKISIKEYLKLQKISKNEKKPKKYLEILEI